MIAESDFADIAVDCTITLHHQNRGGRCHIAADTPVRELPDRPEQLNAVFLEVSTPPQHHLHGCPQRGHWHQRWRQDAEQGLPKFSCPSVRFTSTRQSGGGNARDFDPSRFLGAEKPETDETGPEIPTSDRYDDLSRAIPRGKGFGTRSVGLEPGRSECWGQ